ncbi:5'/3'-nucleotidase SurE [Sulfurihydrogenibium subterraneum]|uniref:5'/3'-nucleotidase SurE n=1 Tax=Sulfurihydrogenibium subterraneum TaxID=171121 RepID=UPI000490DB3D|nr:5'/3'-nucleotidase SurE [Sulfurihydrogenibium subterraneum]
MKKLVFLTNDDGYQSKGLLAIRQELLNAGYEVITITPDRNMSGTSHSLTFTRPLKIVELEKNFYYVADGTPADCVHLGINVILNGKKPDLLVSGINTGPNIGNDVFYSGTVGAAREGTLFDIPSIALSVGSSKNPNYQEIAQVAMKIINVVALQGLPKGTFLNVNIPTIPKNQIKGFLLTKQGRSAYKEEIVKYLSPSKEEYYWIGGEEALLEECQPGTDYTAIKERYVSITPIKLDLTDYQAFEELDKRDFLSEIMRI